MASQQPQSWGDFLRREMHAGEQYREFAMRCGISASYLTKMLTPGIAPPPPETIVRIGNRLGTPDHKIFQWLATIYPEIGVVFQNMLGQGYIDKELGRKANLLAQIHRELDELSDRISYLAQLAAHPERTTGAPAGDRSPAPV